MPESQSFPALRIRKLLDDRGISQAQAAEHIAVSASTLCRVLTGRQPLNVDMAKRLSVYCGISPLDLMAEQAAFDLGRLTAGDYDNIEPMK